MESTAVRRGLVATHAYVVSGFSRTGVLLLVIMAASTPAFAQANAVDAINARDQGPGSVELDGSWNPTQSEDVSNDTVPVDYMALPLNEAARTRALSYNESQLGMIERQCEGWSASYILTGPFGLKIWSDYGPVKGNLLSYTIGAWGDKLPMVIWMDGRPHPSKYAEHTRIGFTTGRWEGNTLVTVTTHMKEGFIRKNGAPASDLAKMTIRFQRHENTLLAIGIIEDPIYLAEPLVWTRNYVLGTTPLVATSNPCIVTFEGTALTNDVPHWLWGKKPYMDELTKKYGIPQDVILGYPETLYPEYRQKMKPAAGR
jgi:hypothetical protein